MNLATRRSDYRCPAVGSEHRFFMMKFNRVAYLAPAMNEIYFSRHCSLRSSATRLVSTFYVERCNASAATGTFSGSILGETFLSRPLRRSECSGPRQCLYMLGSKGRLLPNGDTNGSLNVSSVQVDLDTTASYKLAEALHL